jgi:hypothetical protein
MRSFIRGSALMILALAVSAPIAFAVDSTPDLSSPKKAAAAFALALQKGDFATVQNVTTGSPADYKIMQTLTSMLAASGKLHDAAVARFGPDEAAKIATGSGDPVAITRQIEESEEKLEGDQASITMKDVAQGDSVKLKKSNGQWKVDLAKYPLKNEIAQRASMLDATGKVLAQASTDVSAGKYKTATEASQDIQQRLMSVMGAMARQSQPPTTQSHK